MDKWLRKSTKQSFSLVEEEDVDDPEPYTVASTTSNACIVKKNFSVDGKDIENSVICTVPSSRNGNPTVFEKTEQKTTLTKNKKVVRKFTEKWTQMSEFKNWLVKKIDING